MEKKINRRATRDQLLEIIEEPGVYQGVKLMLAAISFDDTDEEISRLGDDYGLTDEIEYK